MFYGVLRIHRLVYARVMELPVVDFSAEDACNNSQVLDQLHKAFVNIGFVFITNHGIEKHKVRILGVLICTQSVPFVCALKNRVWSLSMDGYPSMCGVDAKSFDTKKCVLLTVLLGINMYNWCSSIGSSHHWF